MDTKMTSGFVTQLVSESRE